MRPSSGLIYCFIPPFVDPTANKHIPPVPPRPHRAQITHASPATAPLAPQGVDSPPRATLGVAVFFRDPHEGVLPVSAAQDSLPPPTRHTPPPDPTDQTPQPWSPAASSPRAQSPRPDPAAHARARYPGVTRHAGWDDSSASASVSARRRRQSA
ncbi:hypothetical protein DFH06DRAFT_1332622 [Mycena polygramma]|nr:hypothetical protein DFH06DRAFT_1332622 [Mycena polygramma]